MSSMNTEIENVNDITVVRVSGKITLGEGDVKMRETVEGLLKDGKRNILLDLGRVGFMDSSGVGELVGCYTTVMNRGGKLKLLNLTKKIKDLLQVTQLHTVFDVFSDEAEALASYTD